MNKKLLGGIERAVATFVQAFLASIIGNASGVTQVEAFKIAAIAGGLSAAKTVMFELHAYTKT